MAKAEKTYGQKTATAPKKTREEIEREKEQEAEGQYRRDRAEEFERQIAYGVAPTLAATQTGEAAGRWAADFVKAFRAGMAPPPSAAPDPAGIPTPADRHSPEAMPDPADTM